MNFDVVFSLEAAAELIRIVSALSSANDVLRASEAIRQSLEINPKDAGTELSEGLYYIDREPIRAFYEIDEETMTIEVTDFRIL